MREIQRNAGFNRLSIHLWIREDPRLFIRLRKVFLDRTATDCIMNFLNRIEPSALHFTVVQCF
jgi:hypothetical protein